MVAGLVVACLPVAPATADTLIQNFDTATGWKQWNNSSPRDTGQWRIGGFFFPESFNGATGSHAESGYDAVAGVGTLSSWLASPVLSGLTQGDTVSFYTRRPSPFLDQPEHPDRLEVRISTSGSCHPGTGPTSVGDFTTLLLSVNPTLVSGVYPAVWTQYQATLPPMTPGSGCVAFRHFVTDAGVGGANGHYVGVDQLEVHDQSDNVRPETTIVSGPSGAAPSSVSFSYSSSPSAGVGGYQCRLTVVGRSAPAFTPCPTAGHSYEDLADGSYRFEVRAVSYGGNMDSSPASQEFVVDGTPPDTTITAGPSGVVATNDVTFGFAGTPAQDVDGVECRLRSDAANDPPFAACGSTSEQAYDDLGDGAYTFEVRAKDAVGNVDLTLAAREFTVDTTAPDTEVTSGPSGLVDRGDAAFGYGSVVEESGVTFECRLVSPGAADPAFEGCVADGRSFTDLADGEHRFEVRARDAVGNVDPTPAAREFTVDTVAPDTEIVSGPSGLVGSDAAAFGYASGVDESGASFECRLDDADFASCPVDGRTFTDLADGGHRFEVRARDAVGNVDASPAAREFTVDTTAPTVTIDFGPEPTGTATAVAFAYSATPDEDVDGIECRLVRPDDADPAFAACADGAASYEGLAVGAYRFELRARDAAGNVSTVADWSFSVETPPVEEPPVVEPPVVEPPGPTGETPPLTPAVPFVPPVRDPALGIVPPGLPVKQQVSGLRLDRTTFRAVTSGSDFGGSGLPRGRGTWLRFKLGGAARIELRISQRVSGRWRPLRGAVTRIGAPGAVRIAVRGRFRGKTLRPGRYRLSVTLTDPVTGAKTTELRQFRIRR